MPVAEWLMVLTSNYFSSSLWVRIPSRTFNSSCDEFIQLAYRTSIVLLMHPIVPEIMHGRTPEIFLYYYSGRVAMYHVICVGAT
jgi:hypothetical protein